MRVEMLKTPNGALMPASEEAGAMLRKIKTGTPVFVEIKHIRNYRFMKKMFALFKLAFDVWQPEGQEWAGQKVEKELERFRKDLTILAGFGRPVFNLRGEVRMEAESLSFANMTEDRFEAVYKAVLNKVWSHILRRAGYADTETVDRVVEELLRFEA